jgi:hypothetical protein
LAVAVIFGSTAGGVVLAVSELAEIKTAVTKHHCNFSHSAYNCGVKVAVATMAETVAAEMYTLRLKIAVAGQYNCGCNCCNYNS